MDVDPSTGNVVFADANSSMIGRLVPSTNTVNEWKIDSARNDLRDLALGYAASEIYFVEGNANKIGQSF